MLFAYSFSMPAPCQKGESKIHRRGKCAKKNLDKYAELRYNISAIVQMAAPSAQDGGRW